MAGEPVLWNGQFVSWKRTERGGRGLDRWYSPQQIATELGVARLTILNWIRKGFLRAISSPARPGAKFGHHRIKRKWLEDMLKAQERPRAKPKRVKVASLPVNLTKRARRSAY